VQRVLAVYLAVDTSVSMAMSGRLEAIEGAIIEFAGELLSSPLLGEQVRVAIVGFSSRAELVLPLTDLTAQQALPRLSAHGVTHYGPLFSLLSKVITRDVRVLRTRDTIMLRPFVFLVTDSLPVDSGWEETFQEFRDATRAQVVIIGIGLDSDSATQLHRLHPAGMYLLDGDRPEVLGEEIFRIVDQYAESLVTSVIVSARSEEHNLRLPPPNPPLGETDIF